MGWRRLRGLGYGWIWSVDTREALRRFFEIDAEHVALAALSSLVEREISAEIYNQAVETFGISFERDDITSI